MPGNNIKTGMALRANHYDYVIMIMSKNQYCAEFFVQL